MAAKRATPTSATYCVARNADMTNCANKTGMPRISMHYFPKDETLRQKWIRFVRIRNSQERFRSIKKQSALCSAHFDETCFDRVGISVYDDSGKLVKPPKRHLVEGSIPSKDSVAPSTSPLSWRKRGKVSSLYAQLFISLLVTIIIKNFYFRFKLMRLQLCET